MSVRAKLVAVALILGAAPRAAAEPPTSPAPAAPISSSGLPSAELTIYLQTTVETTIARDDGTTRRLPPGRFLDEGSWQRLDAELRRLQDAETRLTAENKSMRASTSGWQPGWKILAITLVTGAALGAYAAIKL